jgi:hypothetical protein
MSAAEPMTMPLNPAIKKNSPLFVAGTLATLCVVIFGIFLKWNSLALRVKLTDLVSLLAPLAFAAAIIERAVEILISPWRDSGASKLEKQAAAIRARPADSLSNTQNALDLQAASDALDDYRGDTQRYAFAISLTLSVLVSIGGVRSLEPFIDTAKFQNTSITSQAQQQFFLCVDVALSAALLAGGADGIHSVVNAVTSFFKASADRVTQ